MATENLVKNLQDGDNVNANKEFNTLMADKLTAAIEAKKIEVASRLVQRKTEKEKANETNNRIRRKRTRSDCRV